MLIRPAGVGAACRRRLLSAANAWSSTAAPLKTDPATPAAAAERHRANLEKAC
jgi:hypothetical protein